MEEGERDGGAPLRTRRRRARALVDARPGGPRRTRRLDLLEQTIYAACEEICSRRDLDARIAAVLDEATGAAPARVDGLLADLVAERLMITQGDRYLSLALPDPRDV